MECPECQSPVPEGGTWCLYCGAAVHAPTASAMGAMPTREEADRLLSEGMYREAIRIYARLAAAAGDDAEKAGLYETLADIYCGQGNLRNGIIIYRQAIQLHPTPELRAKYDRTIDRIHGPAGASAPAKEMPDARLRVKSVDQPRVDLAVGGDGLQGIDAVRARLTPKAAALLVTAAVMAAFAAILFTTQPWNQPYQPPMRSLPITPPLTRTVAPSAPASGTQPMLGPRTKNSFIHHQKAGAGVSTSGGSR